MIVINYFSVLPYHMAHGQLALCLYYFLAN